jgi:hypothetical protein
MSALGTKRTIRPHSRLSAMGVTADKYEHQLWFDGCAETARRRHAILDYAVAQFSAGLAHHRRLIVPSWRLERHVETVPTIDCDNRQGKLCQFGLAELLTC